MSDGTVFELQSIGWTDDIPGGQGGILTSQRSGVAVKTPFRAQQYLIELAGTAGRTIQGALFWGNPDGSGSSIAISVPAGLGNGVRIWYEFSGRLFGVYWLASYGSPDFSVTVDGEAVQVIARDPHLNAEDVTTSYLDTAARLVTHDHLDPTRRHLAELTFTSDPDGVTARTWNLYGVLLDEAAGYQTPPRLVHLVPPVVLTNAAAVIGLAGSATERVLPGAKAIIYYNSTGGPVDVTVEYNSVTFWKATVAAGGIATLDFGQTVAINTLWKHYASANASITATVIGGY